VEVMAVAVMEEEETPEMDATRIIVGVLFKV